MWPHKVLNRSCEQYPTDRSHILTDDLWFYAEQIATISPTLCPDPICRVVPVSQTHLHQKELRSCSICVHVLSILCKCCICFVARLLCTQSSISSARNIFSTMSFVRLGRQEMFLFEPPDSKEPLLLFYR